MCWLQSSAFCPCGILFDNWMLEVCILATYRVISGRVTIYDNVHSWWLYSAAPLGDKATCTITGYPTELHYPDTGRTSHSLPYPDNAEQLDRKRKVSILKPLVSLDLECAISHTRGPRSTNSVRIFYYTTQSRQYSSHKYKPVTCRFIYTQLHINSRCTL